MTPVCTCKNPIVKDSDSGGKYCERCGYWYMPEYGSLPQQTSESNLAKFDLVNRSCHSYSKVMNDYMYGDGNQKAILRLRFPSLSKRFDKVDQYKNAKPVEASNAGQNSEVNDAES